MLENKKQYCFTSESVSEGHPDKIADQIADAVLDAMLSQDPKTRVCCEVFVTTNFVLVGGEYRTKADVDVEGLVRNVIREIGYNSQDTFFSSEGCQVEVKLHEQSADIVRGVDKAEDYEQGAGDQGIIFGYATNETEEFLPLSHVLSHKMLLKLKEIRKSDRISEMPYLRPDAKSQITIKYDHDNKPLAVDTIVVSTQHKNFINEENAAELSEKEREEKMLTRIKADIEKKVVQEVVPAHLLNSDTRLFVNPTGKFVIGGPHGDAGLTNRKIIVDTYGGACPHGGGGMSGKDASKVDRSAAYMGRYIAKNMVAAGVADRVLIQLAYAIGVSKPVSVFINTYNSAKVNLSDAAIAQLLYDEVDFSPNGIEERLKLAEPKYFVSAAYGHMGRAPFKGKKHTWNPKDNSAANGDINYFSWEQLDYVDTIKNIFKNYL